MEYQIRSTQVCLYETVCKQITKESASHIIFVFIIHFLEIGNFQFRNVLYDITCKAKTGNVGQKEQDDDGFQDKLHLSKIDFHTPPLCGKALHSDADASAAIRIIVKGFSSLEIRFL